MGSALMRAAVVALMLLAPASARAAAPVPYEVPGRADVRAAGQAWEAPLGAAQTGQDTFLSVFHGPGVDGQVFATATWRGALYMAGDFLTAGGQQVNGIARWDGERWSRLGSGFNGRVLALAVHDGALYAGGAFTQAGDATVNHIARWDGSAWTPLGAGLNDQVQALASFDGELVVGGLFTLAGGDSRASWLARWDGESWAPFMGVTPSGLDSQLSGTVRALAVQDGELVAAGGFLAVGHWDGRQWVDLELAGGVARWSGKNWTTLEGGTDGFVNALAVVGGQLVAGGSFTQAGGQPVSRVARWDGRAWAPLGPGLDGDVNALAVVDGALVAGGYFSSAAARWDGSRWSVLAGLDGVVFTLADFGGVVAGGGLPAVNHIARLQSGRWSAIATGAGGMPEGYVGALAKYQGDLVAGGSFDRAGAAAAANIARWNGRRWAPLGEGLEGQVAALTVYRGELIAGYTGGLARWDGDRWRPLEWEGPVSALTVYHGELIVGGDRIARWNGRRWSALGSGLDGEVRTLTEWYGDLVAGGRFRQAGELTVNGVARWDGAAWHALTGAAGTGVNLFASDLAVFRGDLIVAGSFNRAGGIETRNIAGWDGREWFALGPGINSFAVDALTVFDGALIAGGAFTQIGQEPFNRVARWDGGAWSHLTGPDGEGVTGAPFGSSVLALESLDLDGGGPAPKRLVLGGSFRITGGVAGWGLGVYGRP